MIDGSRYILVDPVLRGDTVVGHTAGDDGPPSFLPVHDIAAVEVRRMVGPHGAITIPLAGFLSAFTALWIVGLAQAGSAAR